MPPVQVESNIRDCGRLQSKDTEIKRSRKTYRGEGCRWAAAGVHAHAANAAQAAAIVAATVLNELEIFLGQVRSSADCVSITSMQSHFDFTVYME